MSAEGLQIAVERKEVKSKGEKERYSYLNAEFQRIARRDKKAFLRNQCKEIEENNRMGKTRDLFKKIRDAKETFHAKMVTIKDRDCVDLTEADNIKNRWQEYIEELYNSYPHNTDNHNEDEVKSLNCVQLFAIPWTAARQASLSFTVSQSLLKLMSIESVMPSNCLLLCCPLLLPPSIFPSIRVFSNESVLRIKWPKQWSFSFTISPPKEYSGLILFRMNWLDLLAVQGNLNSLLQDFSTGGIEGHLASWGTGGLGTEIRQWMSWGLTRRGGLRQGLRPQRGTQREPCGET